MRGASICGHFFVLIGRGRLQHNSIYQRLENPEALRKRLIALVAMLNLWHVYLKTLQRIASLTFLQASNIDCLYRIKCKASSVDRYRPPAWRLLRSGLKRLLQAQEVSAFAFSNQEDQLESCRKYETGFYDKR